MPYIEQHSAPTAALFELIKSLSGPEKRYFKLMASLQKGEKNYLRLFDAIDAQVEYDEQEIRKQFQEEGFARQLHVAKHYLYTLILKSLRGYYPRLSVGIQLREMLADARILYERGLAEQCRQTLEKAKKLAEGYERHLELLEIIQLEDAWFPTPVDSDREIERLYEQRRTILRQLENSYEYDLLGARVSRVVIGTGKTRTLTIKNDFAGILAHPLMEDEEQPLSRQALGRYYYIQSAVHYAIGDKEEALYWTEKILELMEGENRKIIAEPYMHASALINLLTLYKENAHEKFNTCLEKLRSLPDLFAAEGFRSPLFSYWVFVNASAIEIGNMVRLGEFHRALHALPTLQQGLKEGGNLVRQVDRLRCNYTAAYTFFGTEDYRSALHYISKVLQAPRTTPRREVLYTARIMELLIYFEMKEVTLFDYKLQALQRFLARRGRLLPFEAILLKSLRGLPGCTHQQITLNCFRELYAQLSVLRSDPLEQHAFDYFDYLAWLRGKIDGISFAEGIQREREKAVHVPYTQPERAV